MPVVNQVKILVQHGKRYLLLQKKKDVHVDHVGSWEVPGGKVKAGEDAIQAAHREIKEETRLSCILLKELTTLTLEKDGIKTVTRVFLGKALSTNVKLSSEHTAFKWVLTKDVDPMDNVIYKELFKKYIKEAEKIR